MQVYLAGVWPWRNGGGYDKSVTELRPYILESFYYADQDTERLIPYFGDFLLDSGAFTFMQNAGSAVNWDDYAHKYAAFVARNNVKKYIELDLDYIIGCEGARRLRSILEEETGRKAIPVWHPIRGEKQFPGNVRGIRLCSTRRHCWEEMAGNGTVYAVVYQ